MGGRLAARGGGGGPSARDEEKDQRRLEVLKGLPYQWREYDAEDTLRFHALRLHEVGMIKTSPQKIIAQGTDWRFLNTLKGQLKA
jgi:NitT/TauT family transport system substrate-binding protein